jgi:tetratricopeptide (TPR) repeat protein
MFSVKDFAATRLVGAGYVIVRTGHSLWSRVAQVGEVKSPAQTDESNRSIGRHLDRVCRSFCFAPANSLGARTLLTPFVQEPVMLERPNTPRFSNPSSHLWLIAECWRLPTPITHPQQLFCSTEFLEQGPDGPNPPNDNPAALAERQRLQQLALQRRIQRDLLQQLYRLDHAAILNILPQQERDALTTALQGQIETDVRSAITWVLAQPRTTPAEQLRAPLGPNGRPLFDLPTADQITAIRNANADQLATIRREIIAARLEAQTPGELRARVIELLTNEMNSNTFGPVSRATYNRFALWLQQNVITTLLQLDDRNMAFPPGCPVIPVLSSITGRRVTEARFREMVRALRSGSPGNGIDFQLPLLADDGVPTAQQYLQIGNALSWYNDANQLLLPIREEDRRRILSDVIREFNHPGWARDLYPNVEQWEARATYLANLEQQMRACARMIILIHNATHGTFPLEGLDGGNPPFPGQFNFTFRGGTMADGRVVSIDLPDNLHLTLDNRERIERCLAWLRVHGERVRQQLLRIFSAEGNNANIFMYGNQHPTPGMLTRPGEQPPPPAGHPVITQTASGGYQIDGQDFNLVSFDFTVQELDPVNGVRQFRVTPITRYRQSPWFNYQDRLVQGTVRTITGNPQIINEHDLVLVNREGMVQLMTVQDMENWRTHDWRVAAARDALMATIDVSMFFMGLVEMRAAWVASSQIAARVGAAQAARMGLTGFSRMLLLRRGAWHSLLGASGFLSNSYWSDPSTHLLFVPGQYLQNARHWAFMADGALMLMGQPGIGGLGFNQQVAAEMQTVISNSVWLRNIEAVAELDFLRYVPIPYLRFVRHPITAFGSIDLPALGIRYFSSHLALPSLMVGMSVFNIYSMLRGGQGQGIDFAQLLSRPPETPAIEHALGNFLRNLNIDPELAGRLLTIMADDRPALAGLERRRDREQQLIDEYNRPGAPEKDRLAAAILLLLEASRNTENGAIPPDLGTGTPPLQSGPVRDYILSLFRNGQSPEIRMQAAQGLLFLNQITAQEFAHFCRQMAENVNTPREVRAQAIMGIALCMLLAGTAERGIAGRILSGGGAGSSDEPREDAHGNYLAENFGVTRQDLQACLESIARQSGGDRDIRALCAALSNAGNLGSFEQSMNAFQALALQWHAASGRPPDTFATQLVTTWASDLSFPVRFQDGQQGAQNASRVFMAARALDMLSDQSFRPVWQNQSAVALGVLSGGLDASMPGLLSGLATLPATNPLTPELINTALINCVNQVDADIAIRALTILLRRLPSLTDDQMHALRAKILDLLPGLALSNLGYQGNSTACLNMDLLNGVIGGPGFGTLALDQHLTQQSQLQQMQRNLRRTRLIEMLPQIFATANDREMGELLGELQTVLVHPPLPNNAADPTDTPEIRRAAATAIGLLLVGRPVMRNYIGDLHTPAIADTMQALTLNPNPFPMGLQNQLLQLPLVDQSPIAYLETAAQTDPSPFVRLAAVEALGRLRPAWLSNGRTLRQFCSDLLSTETDLAVLSALRHIEFLERAPQPGSPEWLDEFQQAREALLNSLNCSGSRSLAGAPAFLYDAAHGLTHTAHLGGPAPYNADYHVLNPQALQAMASGNGPHALDALKAVVYIIASNGRPFERGVDQWSSVGDCVQILTQLAANLNVGANQERTSNILWALEMCLVLQPNLDSAQGNFFDAEGRPLPSARHRLLEAYMNLIQRLPVDSPFRRRAAVVVAVILQREFVSIRTHSQSSQALQLACIRYLDTYRTRAAIPVLELIIATARPGPLRTAATALLATLTNDPQVVPPGTYFGPRRGEVAFDDALEHLQRQLGEQLNAFYVPPLFAIHGLTAPDISVLPLSTPQGRALIASFENGNWFRDIAQTDLAPNIQHIRCMFAGQPIPNGVTPQVAFNSLLALARRIPSNPPGPQREAELRAIAEARIALIWIVETGGRRFRPAHMRDFVRQARECLFEIHPAFLLASFANGHWFRHNNTHANHLEDILWRAPLWGPILLLPSTPAREAPGPLGELAEGIMSYFGMPAPPREGRPPIWGERQPFIGFMHLLELAERSGGTAAEQAAQRQARMCLMWIVATNGEGLVGAYRDQWVLDAARALERISGRQMDGMAHLDLMLESILVSQPLISQDRRVRLHLLRALWNRRQANGGSISDNNVALILAGALRSEFQTMPRPGEPGYYTSVDIQLAILEYLRLLGHRMCAPVVEALALHHPNAEIKARAQETLIALLDNVWRVWNEVNQTPLNAATPPAERALALQQALSGNGAHDSVVRAIFNNYRGSPIHPGDPRYVLYRDYLADPRPHVRLACALVVLRVEPDASLRSTAFTDADRQAAMAVAADLALHGIHIGLRLSARSILLQNLPNGTYFVQVAPGKTIEIVKTANGLSIVETLNGRPVAVLLTNGQIRTANDGGTPPFFQAIFQDQQATRAFNNFSVRSIAAGLAGPLTNNTVIDYVPITHPNDWRRYWYASDMATGLNRIAQLYALVDARSTAVELDRKQAALRDLVTLALSANPEELRQISWIFAHIDPALASSALFALTLPMYTALNSIPHGQSPSEQQRNTIQRCLDLILLVARSSPMTPGLRNDLYQILRRFELSAFNDSPQIRLIVDLLANSINGPITANADIRLQWLNSEYRPLRYAAARACLLSDSTAVTTEQRRRAIQLIANFAIENDPDPAQSLSILMGLRGADLDVALDALADLADRLPRQTPADRDKIIRCWTLSEQLCQNAHLPSTSERYLRARIGRLRAAGSASGPELEFLEALFNDCRLQRSYDISLVYSSLAVDGYTAALQDAIERYGADSVEAARAELALAKAAYSQSLATTNLSERQQMAQLALRSARHAYQALILHLGPDAPEVCDALYRLGTAEARTANYADAITHLNEALAIYRRNPAVIGVGHGAWIASQLAQAYLDNHNEADASRISEELLRMVAGDIAPGQRVESLDAVISLARLFAAWPTPPRLRSAEALWRRAIEIAQNTHGQSHPTTLNLMRNLAETLAAQGNHSAAERISQDLLRLIPSKIASSHLSQALETLVGLASAFDRSGTKPMLRSAESLWRRALEIAQNRHGQSHPLTLILMLRLAENLATQDRTADAVTVMDRAMRLCSDNKSMSARDRSRLYNAYAAVLFRLGREKEARAAQWRAYELGMVPVPQVR